jgi:hypothetical protein
MAQPTPSSTSNKTFSKFELCKKMKVEQESNNLKGKTSKPPGFMVSLYVELQK